MNLSIRQLQAFREVMRTGSISEAARALNRTQPSVSAMIASLENELGLVLFKREKKRLLKTPEAQYFLGEAEAILERLGQVSKTMHEISNLQIGRLRIACMPAAASFLMPQLVARFLKDKDNVNASLMMRTSAAIEELVATQQYDIGLVETPAANHLLMMEIIELDCVCAVRFDDPLSEKAVIEPMDLSGKPLAGLQADNPNLLETKQAFEAVGATFKQRFDLRTFQPALTLVEEGLCYCICDPITASSYFDYQTTKPQLVFKPFRPKVTLSVSIVQPAHRPASVLAAAFADLLRQEILRINQQFQ